MDTETRSARLKYAAWNMEVRARVAVEYLLEGRTDLAEKYASKYAESKAEYASLMAEAEAVGADRA